MKVIRILLGALGISSFLSSGAHGQVESSVCTQNHIASYCSLEFGDNNAAEALQRAQCLATLAACGRYQAIIANLTLEKEYTASKAYYMGVAYDGLTYSTRSESLRCEYNHVSRRNLMSFLTMTAADSTGLNDITLFQQVYHATTLVENLRKKKGCLESAYTEAYLESYAINYIRDILSTMLVKQSTGLDQALAAVISDTRSNLKSAIQGFSTKAADIENNIALREESFRGNLNTLKSAATLFSNNFGSVSPSVDQLTWTKSDGAEAYPQVSAVTSTVSQDLSDLLDSYSYQSTRLNNLLNSMQVADPSAYEAARQEIVQDARDMIASAITIIGNYNVVEEESELATLVGMSNISVLPGQGADQIYAAWRQYGDDAGHCSSQYWYCRTITEE